MADYYVRTDGNNSNDGSANDAGHAWLTLAKAASTVPDNANHTIHVEAGTYAVTLTDTRNGVSDGVYRYWKANGTVTVQFVYLSGNYVKFEGFTIIGNGSDTTNSYDGALNVDGIYNYILSNTVQNVYRIGFLLTKTTDHCTVESNTIYNAKESGMDIRGTNHLILNNDISGMRNYPATGSGGIEMWDANGFAAFGSGHTFRGNYLHDFRKANITAPPAVSGWPHPDGWQTYQNSTYPDPYGKDALSNTIIEQNHVFWGVDSTGLIEEAWDEVDTIYSFMLGGAASHYCDGLIIRNNIFESWGGINTGNHYVSNIKVYNNTWRSGSGFNSAYTPRAIALESVVNATLYNNITVDFAWNHYYVTGGSGIVYDYNLMWNSNGSTAGLGGYTPSAHDKRSVNGGTIYDPMFVTNFTNLQIQSSSPAKDTGKDLSASGVTVDYAGTARPQGSAYDIGAYEYGTAEKKTLFRR